MAVYRVLNKYFARAVAPRDVVRMDAAGNRIVAMEMSPALRFEVGELLYDLRPEELAAFADRFELVADDEAPPAPSLAAPASATPQLNPELYSLIRRDRAGQTTADEQAVVGTLVTFMEQHAQGKATPEETAAMASVLGEFNLPLFA